MERLEPSSIWPDSTEAFCAELKAARLRSGLTLADISNSTKIAESHFAALERGDLRYWPKGIFRRAFFSDYVRAVGVPVEPAVAAFGRLFPDPSDSPAPAPAAETALREQKAAGELRLVMAGEPFVRPGVAGRLHLTALDALVVVSVGVAGAWLVETDRLAGVAVAALFYYSLAVVAGRPHPLVTLAARVKRARMTRKRAPGSDGAGLETQPTGFLASGLVVGTRLGEWFRSIRQGRRGAPTPDVLDGPAPWRTNRGDRPMARPRPDAPRHQGRRRPDGGRQDSGGVRIRIRFRP